MSLTIGITTFSKRFDLLAKLLNQIRRHNTTDKIIICINGEQGGDFNNQYRRDVLDLCSGFDNVFPTFFIEMRGLTKLWNTIINISDSDNVLLLNDDLEINTKSVFDDIHNHINSGKFKGLTRINQSFSHFLVSKNTMNSIGYFDERLLGFGEEDGDMYYRVLKNNLSFIDLQVNGFVNLVSNTRHDYVKSGIGKYSKFNRDYIYEQKYLKDESSPYKGMFDSPMKQIIQDINCYPLEKFFMDHKHEL